MKRTLLIIFLMIGWVGLGFSQNFNWGFRNGNANQEIGRAIAVDAQNNVYHMFYYTGTISIDSAGTPKSVGNFGNRDIAVVKYDCNKVFQWVIRIGGTNSDGGAYINSGIAVDTSGNLFITGTVNGSFNVTSANGSNQTRAGFGQNDAFLMKANSAGIVTWINQIGSTTGNDEAGGVAVDRNQNVYITGQFTGIGAFTQTTGPNSNLLSFGSSDIYLAKYTNNGVLVYLTRGGGNLLDNGIGIDVDSSGAAYVAGGWGCCGNSFANFGNNINNTGSWGAFIAKADPTGAWVWANTAGSTNDEAFADVVVDDINDRVYAIGHFNGNSNMTSRPPGVGLAIATTGGYDALGACFNLNGSLQWVRTFGSTGTEYGYGATLDLNNNPVFSGEFGGSTNFGGTTLSPTGTVNAYMTRYTLNNVLIDVKKVGNGSMATAWDVKFGSTGLAYLSGFFRDSILTTNDTLRSAGIEDAYVVRLQDNDTTIIGALKTTLNCTSDSTTLFVRNKEIGNFDWYRNDTLVSVSAGNQIKTTLPGTYKAVSTAPCAVPDTSNSIVITKSSFYNAPQISDITICRGDSARFNATGATTYRWFPGTGLSDTTVANPFVKPTVNTTYFLTRTQGICISIDTSVVTLSANCCLTCTTPYQLNQGVVACYPFTGNSRDESGNGNDATVINATLAADRFAVANRSYQFDGFSSYLEVPTSTSLESPSTNISFTFWARVTNWNFGGGVQFNPVLSKSTAAGSAQYRGMIRSNGAYAMANSQSFNGIIGSTTNINTWFFFTISISNDTLYYYRNGVLLGTATGAVPYTLNNTTPLRIGRNDVNSTSFFNGRIDELRIYGRTLSAADVLALYNLSNMNGLPTINAGIDKNICKGDSVQLTTVGTTGSYLWTPNTLLSSDTAKSPWSKTDSTRNYIARVELSGCRNYDTVTVNVTDFIPDAGTDRNICIGDSAKIIVVNGGNTFAWTPNYRITPTNNDTIKVFPLVDTNYVVTSNNGLCSRRDTIRITVNVPTINAGLDQNICLNDTAKFNVVSNGTVRWSPFKYLSDSIGANVYSVADSNITYYLTANYLGCIAKDTISVNVARLPIDAGPNKLICLGDSVQLQATGATTYIWLPSYRISDSSVANPWVKPLVPTYYYAVSYNLLCSRYDSVFVDVKQAQANAGPDKNVCNNDSVQLKAIVLGPHSWSPTSTLSDTSLQPYAKPLTNTTYYLTVNNFGCMAYDTVNVSVTNFNISAGIDTIVCKGDSIQLQASGSLKYNWLPLYNISDTSIGNPWVHPFGPTNYFLLATNGICLRIDTVFVDVRTLAATAGLDTSMCFGLSVELNASGGATYQWINKYNLSDAFIANPVATPAFDTTYIVKITDGSSCTVYDSVFVRVDNYPVVDAGISFQKHCPGEFVNLNGSVTDYEKFEWMPATGLNDKNLMQPIASVTQYTKYALVANNGYCYSSDTAVVDVNPKVVASFSVDPDRGLAPLPVNFTNTSTNAYFYTWEFGDLAGGGSTSKDPSYIYTDDGKYTAVLVAEDSLGCTDTARATIIVTTIETIFAPSAFTPNGDGLNDLFVFVYNANRFEFLEFSIFNRWGVKVYESKMPNGKWWDGKTDGLAEPPGIFTYTATAKDKKGKSYELNGTISIVR